MPIVHLKSPSEPPVAIELVSKGSSGSLRYQAKCNEQTAEVEISITDSGNGSVRSARGTEPFAGSLTDRIVEVWFGGRTYTLEVVNQRTRRTAGSHASAPVDELAAPMPGTILRIDVQPGESFEAHQSLIIMESMKMEMTLSSPHSGRVIEVKCRAGELVPMGRVLARLEATKNDDRTS